MNITQPLLELAKAATMLHAKLPVRELNLEVAQRLPPFQTLGSIWYGPIEQEDSTTSGGS